MRRLYFTKELIEDYYENKFQKDLAGCFLIRKNEDGIKVVDRTRSFPGIFYNHEPAEKQILFIAMTSFMLSAEEKLMWKVPDLQTSKLHDFLNAFGFPVFPNAARRYGLEYMLKYFEIDRELWSTDEVETLRDAMKLVEPFMLSKLRSHFETWNHGFFDYLLDEGIEDKISHTITEGLQRIYCRMYQYRGLTGIEISHRDFMDYYNHHFYPQFRRYFSCAKNKGTCLLVLHVYDQANNRWADEMPGRDAKENLLFASIMLYMVIAEQSILEHAPAVHEDFHRCFGWPMIYSGPGAGPYLHPLKMLEYAGLSPKKYEAPLFLEVVKKVFYYLRQDMNTLLNERRSVIKDPFAGKRFFDTIKGHKKSRIRKYLDRQEKSVQELLVKWTTSPEDCWYKMLESEGVPIMMPIKQT